LRSSNGVIGIKKSAKFYQISAQLTIIIMWLS
jgi:hypothetical protein